MANFNHDQALLTEQLLLLHKLDLDYPDDSALHDFGEGMKPLNTIALLLSTGLPGEHFAAAFDKRLGLELVLAKNGTPTSEDIADAKELFSRLYSPEVRRGSDLYPFVARRCRANVLKRVSKLLASVIDTGFNDDFYSRLDQNPSACEPLSPSTIEREFPRDTDTIIEDYTDKSLSTISRDLLDSIIGGAVASEVPSREKFFDIYISALALAHSRFLQQWVKLKDAGYQKVLRFQRCAAKLCRYINDVHSLQTCKAAGANKISLGYR
ncbi:hypothetical protein AGABI1DRAFT_108678 [Agaricus bisporus var. burnettii JB137-S8]|uniref:Uncharacterized protein n=1 Tax=Agaricus bisporus var. burnettii (strain JB137-S8 / ATCC MYA-4627 / FGSC 10392) TaxID=597362 RepID=K5VQ73_AGABU|nr:uncharacterized protein AGABI1DRAFT_108678 [Agaricus bisporus var. burnettii JB137-S8]EKM76594.1 hypothetical protein AGABI1DRAFT_108678 [Agaricus bisporus var. burnettii JB137-S8]